MNARTRTTTFAAALAFAVLASLGVGQPPPGERPRGPRPEAGPAAAIAELRAVEEQLRSAGNTEAADRIAGVAARMEQRQSDGAPGMRWGPGGHDEMPPPPGHMPPPPGMGPEGRPRFGAPDGIGPPLPMGPEAVPAPVREAYKSARASEEQIARLEKKLEREAQSPNVAEIERELDMLREEHKAALGSLNAQAPQLHEAIVDMRKRLDGLMQAAGDDAPRPRLKEASERLGRLAEAAEQTKPGDSPELYRALREQANFLQRVRAEAPTRDSADRVERLRGEMGALRDRLDRLQREMDTLQPPPATGAAPPAEGEKPLPKLD